MLELIETHPREVWHPNAFITEAQSKCHWKCWDVYDSPACVMDQDKECNLLKGYAKEDLIEKMMMM